MTQRTIKKTKADAPGKRFEGSLLAGDPLTKKQAQQVLSLHLSNVRLMKEEANSMLDYGLEAMEVHRRVLCEKRVSEQEVLEAVKAADMTDPKISCMLSEIAKESGFASVQVAAEKALDKAKQNDAYSVIDRYARHFIAIERYGDNPGEVPHSEEEVIMAIDAADKQYGFLRSKLAEIAGYCEFEEVKKAAKRALEENPIESVVQAMTSGLNMLELFETIKILVEKGADVNEKDENGNTALHLAATWNFPKLVNYLAAKAEDIDVRNDGGYTPLMRACTSGMVENAKIFIGKGADVNTRNIYGKTILGVTDGYYNDRSEIVRFLKEKGAQMQ